MRKVWHRASVASVRLPLHRFRCSARWAGLARSCQSVRCASSYPRPVREPMPMSSTAGEFITETLEYDGGRQVTAYVPAGAAEAVVFAGDGQLIASWGEVLEAADLPPTMIIGVHRVEDETLRLHEYSLGGSTAAFVFDPQRFAAHEKFFVEDIRRWAATRLAVRLPVGRTAVFGVSAGAELALAMRLRHPDIYGAVLGASPGAGSRPPTALPGRLPRTYLV